MFNSDMPDENRLPNPRGIRRRFSRSRWSFARLAPIWFFALGVFTTLLVALNWPLLFVEILSRFGYCFSRVIDFIFSTFSAAP
jgi:hypothetical protein